MHHGTQTVNLPKSNQNLLNNLNLSSNPYQARISTTGGRNNIEGLDVPYGRYGGVTDSDNS
eukprot:345582-Amorphochlora_amoeboformis.AAC.1